MPGLEKLNKKMGVRLQGGHTELQSEPDHKRRRQTGGRDNEGVNKGGCNQYQATTVDRVPEHFIMT